MAEIQTYLGDETFSKILQILGAGAHDTNTTITAADLAQLHKVLNATDSSGLIRCVKIPLAGGVDTAGGVGGWTNTEAGSIMIRSAITDITTIASAACALDIGTTATSLVTLSDNLLDGIDVHAGIASFDNLVAAQAGTNGLTNVKLAANMFITISTVSGASAGLVGNLYVYYNLA